MGIFDGGGDSSSQDNANNLMQQQIDQNNAELEQKRQSLVEQRMAIVKSQGAETWSPDRNASAAGSGGSTPVPPKVFGESGGWWNGTGGKAGQ